jgi:ketosteroid isomerase-like protein
MSQENVEIVRRAYAEFEHGNFSVPEFFDPHIRVVWLPAIGSDRETVGLPEMGRVVQNWMRSWDHARLIAERFIDAGDQVVVTACWRARGRASGVNTDWRHGSVWTLRDGKAISVVSHPNPAEALKAAGLAE